MWLIVALLFGIIEIVTVNFYTLWLAIAAVVVAILSVFGLGTAGQIIAFSVISLLLVLLSESVVRKVVFGNKGEFVTNVEAIKNQEGIVTFTINNQKGEGVVKIRGTDWSARSALNEVIEVGEHIIVERIEGVKVVVHKKHFSHE